MSAPDSVGGHVDAELGGRSDTAVLSRSFATAAVTPPEAAAALVVVDAALETAAQGATESAVSPWQRSQRGLRNTLTPGAGRWR